MPNVVMPGGNLLAGIGGHLQLWNWKAPLSQTTPPTPINFRDLDVAHWQLFRKRVNSPIWYSGCFGSMRRRGIIMDWILKTLVWWDFANPPDVQLRPTMQFTDPANPANQSLLAGAGDAFALRLTIGMNSNWTGNWLDDVRQDAFEPNPGIANTPVIHANGLGILADGATYLPSYCSPDCLWGDQNTFDTSEPDENGIVFQDLIIEGSSLIWYLDVAMTETAYQAYVMALAQQNFLPYN